MAIDPSSALSALNAYQNQLKLGGASDASGTEESSGSSGSGGSSFSQLVSNALKDAAGAEHKADAAMTDSMTGKVDLSSLVTAVSNAELTLNTVVAVRDRVINAYQDIIKMSI